MTSKQSVIGELLGVAIEPTYFDMEHYHLDVGEVVKTAKGIGANAIRAGMFSHQGHAYYPSKVAPEAPFLNGRNLLKEFEEECGKQGISLVVYLNSKWVKDLYRQHPDWGVILGKGPTEWGIMLKKGPLSFRNIDRHTSLNIYPMCPNSPFLDYFKKIIREVASISRPAAVYIDNFAIIPFCCCKYCQKKFGGKIPESADWDSPSVKKYLRWMIAESRALARGIVAAARSRNPQMPVIFNRGQFWSVNGAFSPEDNSVYAHQIANAVHTEAAVRFYNQSFEHINEQCAFGRSINLPVWTWVEYQMLPHSYTPPSPVEAKIKAAKVLANGGRPMVWNMPCAPLVSRKGMSGLREVFTLAANQKELFCETEFEKFAGLVFSSRSLMAICRGDRGKIAAAKKEFCGAHELLIRLHQPYDFLLDEHLTLPLLGKYKVIILPDVVSLTATQVKSLESYVQKGGAVFATGATSLCDENGARRADFGLKRLFAAAYCRELGLQTEGFSAGYARFIAPHEINKNGLEKEFLPLAGKYLGVKSGQAIAKLLGRCRYYCDYPQPMSDYAAVIVNTFGKGKVVYIPGEFFAAYHEKGFLEYAQLLRQSLEFFTDNKLPVETDIPDTVELTVTKNKKGAIILHFINCTFDKTRPIMEIVPVAGRYLVLRTDKTFSGVSDVSTGRKIKWQKEKGLIRMELPPLTGYNVIVVS